MYRKLLRSKIHRATVTDSNLAYEGSITIDMDLLARANMVEYELVQVVNIDNGARFETYIIAGEAGFGKIEINGAAARLVHPGDKIIAMAYGMVAEDELLDWTPTIILVDDNNLVKET
jgi:aspartate 1-decarboxylase